MQILDEFLKKNMRIRENPKGIPGQISREILGGTPAGIPFSIHNGKSGLIRGGLSVNF